MTNSTMTMMAITGRTTTFDYVGAVRRYESARTPTIKFSTGDSEADD